MKPVAIFQHARTEGPGYCATFFDENAVPWRLIRIDAGEAVPQDVTAFSGLVLMGGPMSVHDDRPWIPEVLRLIRRAADLGVPVLGHCLGGQLMAKALGGTVSKNPVKEIGWGEVTVADDPIARHWFGDMAHFTAFHWHGETFTIPPGATRLLSSPYCANQTFALGPHLGMQCHVEMTQALIRTWCELGAREIAASDSPAVQTADRMLADLDARVDALNAVAARLYRRWIAGISPL